MTEPRWLSKDEVLALHSRAIALYGGTDGLRDAGLLESALGRPRNLHAHRKATLPEIAAAYAIGLASNHPFVDGNKRVAFYAAFTFLRINGVRLEAPEAEVVRMVTGLADKSVTAARFATWLKAHRAASTPRRKAKRTRSRRSKRNS